jgi:phytoene dehydrogenase-like protein
MGKKVLIIGGGVYGLAAGTYLAMNGFDTEIHEMHHLPGGLCTSWTCKGYTFDFCIHWLMGSSPGKNLYTLWEELGVVQGRKMIEHEIYIKWEHKTGETFTAYTDPEKLRSEMHRVGPDDKRLIDQFIHGIITFAKLDLPARKEDETLRNLLKMLPHMPAFLHWGGMTITQFAHSFKSPVLRQFFIDMYGADSMADFPVIGMMMMLSFMAAKSNGYPVGGSLKFAQAMENTCERYGGKIFYNHKVDKILVEGSRAAGIMVNGREICGDYVISAADGYTTLYKLLEGKYLTPQHEQAYRTWKIFPSLVYVALGLDRKFEGIPSMYLFNAKNPITIEDGRQTLTQVSIRLFNQDETLAPAGKTVVVSSISTYNYDYWVTLQAQQPAEYAAEKERIANWIIAEAENYFKDFKDKVEVIDVATPATIIRYTGNWRGSYEGWLPNRHNMMKTLPATVPGLDNFYMHGQWITIGGGVPPAAMGGRKLAQEICRREKIKFRAGYA